MEEAELSDLLRLMWDSESTGEFQWFGFRMGKARELERRWHEDGLLSDDKPSMLAVGVEDEPVAGWVTWSRSGRFGMCEIGIALFPTFRRRGIGTQAQRQLVDYLFNTTTVHRIQAGTEIDNVAEQRALQRAGFRSEGVQRGLYFRAGQWRDSAMYALLRSDWSATSGSGD